jgi:hypothetical protein
MAYRKKTLRTMSPTARKVARLTGELESVARRLKNLIPELQQLDLDSRALAKARAIYHAEAEKPAEQILQEAIDYDLEGSTKEGCERALEKAPPIVRDAYPPDESGLHKL